MSKGFLVDMTSMWRPSSWRVAIWLHEAERMVKVQGAKPSGDTELEVADECIGTARKWKDS